MGASSGSGSGTGGDCWSDEIFEAVVPLEAKAQRCNNGVTCAYSTQSPYGYAMRADRLGTVHKQRTIGTQGYNNHCCTTRNQSPGSRYNSTLVNSSPTREGGSDKPLKFVQIWLYDGWSGHNAFSEGFSISIEYRGGTDSMGTPYPTGVDAWIYTGAHTTRKHEYIIRPGSSKQFSLQLLNCG